MAKNTVAKIKKQYPDQWKAVAKLLTDAKTQSGSYTFGAWFNTNTGVGSTYGGCNAWMNQRNTNSKDTLIVGFHGINVKGKAAQSFLSWVLSKDSVFAQILDEIGDDCCETFYNEEKEITGWATTNLDINSKNFVNFFKSIRTLTEHRGRLDFWEKYHMEKGYDPKIVYMMMYSVSMKGEMNATGHAPLESSTFLGGIDIQKFTMPYKKWSNPWKLNTSLYSKGGDYSGENKATWDGKFNVYKDIIKTKIKTVPTRFYYKYFEKPTNGVDLVDLEQFMKDATDGSVVKKYERFFA